MFKISPIQNFDEQRECLELCGSSAREGFFAYAMREENGRLLGVSQFEINRGEGYISDLRSSGGIDDFEAMFILGRATMNFIDLCGAHKCRASKDAGDERLLRSIGFKEDGDTLFVDMSGFFDGKCGGHTVEKYKM